MTCELLGTRRVLLIGDSTMSQTASTLMNVLFPVCATQIFYAPGDTLIAERLGHLNRGKRWNEYVYDFEPDIVVVTAGAHIYPSTENNEDDDSQYQPRGAQGIAQDKDVSHEWIEFIVDCHLYALF